MLDAAGALAQIERLIQHRMVNSTTGVSRRWVEHAVEDGADQKGDGGVRRTH
jgi:hypothetical protein